MKRMPNLGTQSTATHVSQIQSNSNHKTKHKNDNNQTLPTTKSSKKIEVTSAAWTATPSSINQPNQIEPSTTNSFHERSAPKHTRKQYTKNTLKRCQVLMSIIKISNSFFSNHKQLLHFTLGGQCNFDTNMVLSSLHQFFTC